MPEVNRRNSLRNYSYAKVVFLDRNILGYVRDISQRGMRVEVFSDREEEPREGVTLTVIPDPDLKLDPFNLQAQVRWSRPNGPTVSVGLQVERFRTAKGKRIFSRLRALLAATA
jgi:hypothetical protein